MIIKIIATLNTKNFKWFCTDNFSEKSIRVRTAALINKLLIPIGPSSSRTPLSKALYMAFAKTINLCEKQLIKLSTKKFLLIYDAIVVKYFLK